MLEPTFTLEHEEQTWRIQDEHDHAVYLTREGTGKITIRSFTKAADQGFRFINSDPNTVLAIGRLLEAAARKAGATDA